MKVYEYEHENPSIEKFNSFKETVMSHYAKEIGDINQISTEVSLALQEFIEKDSSEYHFRGWIRGDEREDPRESDLNYNIEQFLDEKKRRGRVKSTLETYRTELKILRIFFEGRNVRSIEHSDIKEFLNHREDNYSVTSKNSLERIRGNLNSFFDWLVEENKIEKNPVKKVSSYKVYKTGNKALTDKELTELRNACISIRERALLETLLSTGCQLSEIERMYISNIDWHNKTLRLIDSREQEKIVFFTMTAEKHLKKYLQSRQDKLDILFVSERKPYRQLSHRAIQNEITNIKNRTSISRNITPRTFRDTFARLMSSRGHQVNIIDTLLGYHSKSIRTESYYKITNENIWEIVGTRPDF